MNNDLNMSKNGMVLGVALIIVLIIILFLITDYKVEKEFNEATEGRTTEEQYSSVSSTISSTISENSVNSDYIAENCIILKKINTYYRNNYKNTAILSGININHIDEETTIVTINITSEEMDNIYAKKNAFEWNELIAKVININQDIFNNSDINVTQLNTNVILYEDFNTVLFTVNSDGHLTYNILED
jgi:hypothetical protein